MNDRGIRIREAGAADAAGIARLYNYYILNSTATFEEEPVGAAELAGRIAAVGTAGLPWLVATAGAGIAGYAYAGRWKERCAYRYSVETSVYVDPQRQSRGIGTQLYAALLARLHEIGMHVAMGGIALPNAASIALHERLGFVKVAHFPEVGHKFGRWIDIGYWHRKLK